MKRETTVTSENTPVVFWHSDPVGPDETIVLAGGNFGPDAVVDLSALSGESKAKEKWMSIKPLQATPISLKAVVPANWEPGIYACRVRCGESVSKTVFVNTPDVWWKQGDEGIDRARCGGWLRVLGKCLDFGGGASVELKPVDKSGPSIKLELENASCYSLKAMIPKELPAGRYTVVVGNGKGGLDGLREAGVLEILPVKSEPKVILSVLDFGADPTGMKDCSLAIVQTTERLSALGGGVVFFPRGRYRIDSVLRSGNYIDSPLLVPEGVTFRGESPDLVSLWWPDRAKALTTLIQGGNDFTVENLSIYTQGYHSCIITGDSGVRIRNVRIRANCFYMSPGPNGGTHHNRTIKPSAASGSAILLWGANNQVTDCDIVSSNIGFDIRCGRGNLISGNTGAGHFMQSPSEMIFENNTGCIGNIALHMGGTLCKHVYYAHNTALSNCVYGDHEAMTMDGAACAYVGRVKNVKGIGFTLAKDWHIIGKRPKRGTMKDMHGTAVYIVDGRGTGQYRWVTGYKGLDITIDREWDLPPDATSLITIGGFNGRHLFIGNKCTDTGTAIQLYPSNCECIIAEYQCVRTSNINSLGKIKRDKETGVTAWQPSWYNQFLDNHIIVGNGWGGGSTQIDRWIGGESTLNIWGWNVDYFCDESGADQDSFLTPESLMEVIGEDSPRTRCIPSSRFQIVRRHRIDNNSSIRIHGAVADVLIEGCDVKLSRKGIRIDMEMDYRQPEDLGQCFDFDPEPDAEHKPIPFLSPEAVLVRKNCFHEVQIPYSGTAQEGARIEK